jgi:ABC-type transport system involved in multi-copper enzyme maturation permease subunit
MGRVIGALALAVAAVGIFVPLTGILFSLAATALAIVAALCGEYRLSGATSAVVAINSFVLSPSLWVMVPRGQLIMAIYILCLVGAPFCAMALSEYVPLYRVAVVLSAAWMLFAPLTANQISEHYGNERFHTANSACLRERSQWNIEVSKVCYDRGAAAKAAGPNATPISLVAVSLAPVAGVWFAFGLLGWLRRGKGDTANLKRPV